MENILRSQRDRPWTNISDYEIDQICRSLWNDYNAKSDKEKLDHWVNDLIVQKTQIFWQISLINRAALENLAIAETEPRMTSETGNK